MLQINFCLDCSSGTSTTNVFVCEWATEFHDWSDTHFYFLIGCSLFKINPREHWLRCQRNILPTVEWVWGDVWLIETTKSQKCLHKLLNYYIDVVILCCDWDSDPPFIVVTDKRVFCLKSHHIITMSRCGAARPIAVLPASCCRGLMLLHWHEASLQTDGWGLLFYV